MDIIELQEAISNELQKAEANVSLYIKDLDKDKTIYKYDETRSVISASIIKVPIMLTALKKVQMEQETLETKIRVSSEFILKDTEVFEYGEKEYSLNELLVWMIINSDNTATNCLINYLSLEAVNAYCNCLDLKRTRLERKMLDFDGVKLGYNNYTSAYDMFLLFKALYDKNILTPSLCEYSLSVLKRQRHKQNAMRYLYEDITFAHKTGELDGLDHDAGIFYLNNVTYYFGAFVTNARENDYGKKLIGRISKLVYDYYRSIDRDL